MGFSIFVGTKLIMNEHSYKTCNFNDDAKGGFDDKYISLSAFIWILNFVNEHNGNEIFRQRKESLSLWDVTASFSVGDCNFKDNSKVISEDKYIFWLSLSQV